MYKLEDILGFLKEEKVKNLTNLKAFYYSTLLDIAGLFARISPRIMSENLKQKVLGDRRHQQKKMYDKVERLKQLFDSQQQQKQSRMKGQIVQRFGIQERREQQQKLGDAFTNERTLFQMIYSNNPMIIATTLFNPITRVVFIRMYSPNSSFILQKVLSLSELEMNMMPHISALLDNMKLDRELGRRILNNYGRRYYLEFINIDDQINKKNMQRIQMDQDDKSISSKGVKKEGMAIQRGLENMMLRQGIIQEEKSQVKEQELEKNKRQIEQQIEIDKSINDVSQFDPKQIIDQSINIKIAQEEDKATENIGGVAVKKKKKKVKRIKKVLVKKRREGSTSRSPDDQRFVME